MAFTLDALLDLLDLERIEHNIFRGRSQDLGWGPVAEQHAQDGELGVGGERRIWGHGSDWLGRKMIGVRGLRFPFRSRLLRTQKSVGARA